MRYYKGSVLRLFLCFVSCLFLFNSCEQKENESIEKDSDTKHYSIADYYNLKNINTVMPEPQPGDWLDWKEEEHQIFASYKKTDPVCVSSSVNRIYILPMGKFSHQEDSAINIMIEYMSAFFGLEVIKMEPISDSIIPEDVRRGEGEGEQLNSRYIIRNVLPEILPEDGIVLMAISKMDLYPADDWFFVFGQASLTNRVGVSSISRLRKDYLGLLDYGLLGERIMRTGCHETTHMLTIPHCTAFKCMMNGSNHLQEADSKPMHLCPDCLAKLIYSLQDDVIARYDRLITFYEKHGFTDEKRFCEISKEIMLECE